MDEIQDDLEQLNLVRTIVKLATGTTKVFRYKINNDRQNNPVANRHGRRKFTNGEHKNLCERIMGKNFNNKMEMEGYIDNSHLLRGSSGAPMQSAMGQRVTGIEYSQFGQE